MRWLLVAGLAIASGCNCMPWAPNDAGTTGAPPGVPNELSASPQTSTPSGSSVPRSVPPVSVADPPAFGPEGATGGLPPPASQPEPAAVGLEAALTRAIVNGDGPHAAIGVDPFVAAAVIETLRIDQGRPTFERDFKNPEQKKGPRGYRVVVPLAPEDLFHRLGLRQGDLITKIGDVGVRGPGRVRRALQAIHDTVEIRVRRQGEVVVLKYELREGLVWRDVMEATTGRKLPQARPAPPTEPNKGGARSSSRANSTGRSSGRRPSPPSTRRPAPKPEVIPITCSSSSRCVVDKKFFDKVVASNSRMQSEAKVSNASQGYRLRSVKPGGAVSKLGFRAGDVITRINGRNLRNQFEALQVYLALKATRTFNIRYERGGRKLSKTVVVK